jgi:hypothetical protein
LYVRYAQNNIVATQNNEINVGTQKENVFEECKRNDMFVYLLIHLFYSFDWTDQKKHF